jgi:hypothetical protein
VSAPEILPDCRTAHVATPRGATPGPGGFWVPTFCANCGAEGGKVPEENMTFLFWLCNKCAETHGQIAGTMMMPDEVFFERLKQEQLAYYGRIMTEEELIVVVQEDASPLARLIKERR